MFFPTAPASAGSPRASRFSGPGSPGLLPITGMVCLPDGVSYRTKTRVRRFMPFARAEVDLFVVSLMSQSGAVSMSRPSALEAVVLARKLECEGDVAITTPAGNILDLGEFIAIFDLR